MPTLDWPTVAAQLRVALDGGCAVSGPTAPDTYSVTSRSGATLRKVWVRGTTANCSCELATKGFKPCPHAALALVYAAWQRAEVKP